MELDLNLRVRIHELEKHLADQVASVPLQQQKNHGLISALRDKQLRVY